MTPDDIRYLGIDLGSTTVKYALLDASGKLLAKNYVRHQSAVVDTLVQELQQLGSLLHSTNIGQDTTPPFLKLNFTGSAALDLSRSLHAPFVQEVVAASTFLKSSQQNIDVAIELGGEDGKIIFMTNGVELRMNEACAGGTGAFADQMASLLNVSTSQLNSLAALAQRTHPIASRCGVFAKTDVVALLNQGVSKAEIAKSVFEAICEQTISGLACGRPIVGNVCFLGGPLSFLTELKKCFLQRLAGSKVNFVELEHAQYAIAIGAAEALRQEDLSLFNKDNPALLPLNQTNNTQAFSLPNLIQSLQECNLSSSSTSLPPLFVELSGKQQVTTEAKARIANEQQAPSLANLNLKHNHLKSNQSHNSTLSVAHNSNLCNSANIASNLTYPTSNLERCAEYGHETYNMFKQRHAQAKVESLPLANATGPLFLGIDLGSTTLKMVLLNTNQEMLASFYAPNGGAPLNFLLPKIQKLLEDIPSQAYLAAICTTGYGAELAKAALNAQFTEVETLAHQRAAVAFDPNVSYVIDIGGQDMKCIQVNQGVISSIQLNEACSAGCGSFLETFAAQLNLPLEQFVQEALHASAPCDLGTRCTVFMNSKVKQAQRDNTPISDIAAGLCLSIVRNALYKVLRIHDSAQLGEHIVVQGGTFLNDAILRAFELNIGKNVIRPNIAGLMGAFGAALLAIERCTTKEQAMSFSPEQFDLSLIKTSSFRCKGCNNHCALTVNTFKSGQKHIQGNRCDFALKTHQQKRETQGNFCEIKNRLLFERPVLMTKEQAQASHLQNCAEQAAAQDHAFKQNQLAVPQNNNIAYDPTPYSQTVIDANYSNKLQVSSHFQAKTKKEHFASHASTDLTPLADHDLTDLTQHASYDLPDSTQHAANTQPNEQALSLHIVASQSKQDLSYLNKQNSATKPLTDDLGTATQETSKQDKLANLNLKDAKSDVALNNDSSLKAQKAARAAMLLAKSRQAIQQRNKSESKEHIHYLPVSHGLANRGVIGIPRVLNMFEHYPFWHALFTHLGFSVRLSPPSNAAILSSGNQSIPSQSLCLPAKLAHGHISYLASHGIDRVFLPCIPRETVQDYFEENDEHFACPVIAGYPEALRINLSLTFPNLQLFTPFLMLNTVSKIIEAVQKIDPNIKAGEIKQAIQVANTALSQYKQQLKERALAEIERSKREHKPLIVLAGHPYHIDPFINHGIPALLSSMDTCIVTEDAIAYLAVNKPQLEVVNQWAFHSRLYRAASFVIENPHAQLVQLVSFGCGLDAITSEQVKKLLQRHNRLYTMLKIDEGDTLGAAKIRLKSLLCATHKSYIAFSCQDNDAPCKQDPCQQVSKSQLDFSKISNGNLSPEAKTSNQQCPYFETQSDSHEQSCIEISKQESLSQAIASEKQELLSQPVASKKQEHVKSLTCALAEHSLDGRTLYMPQMAPIHFPIVASCLRKLGYNVQLLEDVSDADIEQGLKYINNDACYPAIVAIGQLLHPIITGKIDPNKSALLLAQTCGSCRATNYTALLDWALQELNTNIPVVTLQGSSLEDQHLHIRPSLKGLKLLITGLLYGDLLQHLYMHTQTYEVISGQSAQLLSHYQELLADNLPTNRAKFTKLARQIIHDFAQIPLRHENRPKVGIVGEILLKYHPVANNHIVEHIIAEGGEPVLGDITAFVLYCLHGNVYQAQTFGIDKLKGFVTWFLLKYFEHLRESLVALVNDSSFAELPSFKALLNYGQRFTTLGQQAGEGWLLEAEMLDFIEHGVPNIICVQPFACLPNHITGKGLMRIIREKYPMSNLCSLDFEAGTTQSNILNRLKLFMSQARHNLLNEQVPLKMQSKV